jgi:ankyrin repeat protein
LQPLLIVRSYSATVNLTSDQGVAFYTSVNMSGEFRFEGLAPGNYSLRIEAPGFAANEYNGFYVQENSETRLDQTLEVATIEETVEVESDEQVVSFGGAVAFVAPTDPFIRAAQQDDMEEVTKLIAGRDVNLRDKASNTTALEHAVRNANREMVQLLLAAGAKVNLANESGQTVLMMLDTDATSDLVWDLINAGAKVNSKDKDGDTPLMNAARYNNVDLIRTLLEAGAEVEARNEGKQTAVMQAASEGLVNIIKTLVMAGANINAVDGQGKNALSYALEGEHKAAARLLRTQGGVEIAKVEKGN